LLSLVVLEEEVKAVVAVEQAGLEQAQDFL
jgi:hypothetical protein